MREDLKEAPVYLSVMSADPHVPINKSNPSNNDNKTTHDLPSHQGRDGGNTAERKKSTTATPIATTTSRSSSSNNNIEHEDSTHPVETPHQPDSNSLLVHSVMSANTTESGSENTKSAFEIISVSAFDAADDMEQTKGMSHEADSFMEAAKHRGQSESSESDEILRTSLSGGGGGGVSKHAGNILVNKEQLSETNERVLPLEMATNGPVVQPVPRRFRRVNKYERGRWVIEDALEHRETEERPESEMRGVYSTQGASSRSSAGPVGLGRESPFSQRRKPGEGGAGGGAGGEDLSQLHSRSSSDVGGQGLDSPNTGERENIERGDVTSNLSRNTSVSSLTTAGDKSVDGDHSSDRFSQLKDESETDITYPQPYPQQSHTYTTGNSTQATPPQQQLGHSEATITTTMAAITTNTITSSVGMDMTQAAGSSKTGERVAEALLHLNNELRRLVEENKEITPLKDANSALGKKNRKLQSELDRLEEDGHELRVQNKTLLTTITGLQLRITDLNEKLNTQLENYPTTTMTTTRAPQQHHKAPSVSPSLSPTTGDSR